MIETLERFLQCEWSVFCPGLRPPRRVRIAMLSSSREAAGTRVLLAFGDHAVTPTLVARIPRHPSGAERLEHEWRLLQRLWTSLPEPVRPRVPEPLCMTTVRGMPVFVQRALPGRNLKTLIQRGHRAPTRKQLERDLESMERWMAAFQQARPLSEPGVADISRFPHFASWMAEAAPVLVRENLVSKQRSAWLIACAEALDAGFASHPPCWVHGDFWPGNVLEHGKAWGVIDWDDVSIGPPWIDRVWFALHLAALYHARRTRDPDLRHALGRTLFSPRPFGRPVRTTLETVFADTGVTYREAVLVLLACHAADVLAGRKTRRVFTLAAPRLLHDWLSSSTPVPF